MANSPIPIFHYLRVGQQNLRRAREATAEFGARALNLGIDVALLQEPYAPFGKTIGVGAGARIFEIQPAGASIAIFNKELKVTFLSHISDRWRTVIHIAAPGIDIHFVSAYFKYGDPREDHVKGLSHTVDTLRGRNLVIGADLNAHSTMWGELPRSAVGYAVRNNVVEDFVLGSNLRVAGGDRAHIPTYYSPTGESTPDATLFSLTRPLKIADWKVRADACLSDHRMITFNIDLNDKAQTIQDLPHASLLPRRFNVSRADWERFDLNVETETDLAARNLGESASEKAEALQIAIIRAAEDSMPRSRIKPSTKEQPRWWTPALSRAKSDFNRANRKFLKIRNVIKTNLINDPTPKNDPIAEARETLRDCKKKFKRLIRTAKRRHWRDFVDRESAENTWGKHYRCVKMSERATASLSGITAKNGIIAVDSKRAADNILEALLPEDPASTDTPKQASTRRRAREIPSDTTSTPFSELEIETALARLRARSSPGLDCITSIIIRKSWRTAGPIVRTIFNDILKEGVFPDVWKPGKMIILKKPGRNDLTNPKTYRPITLLPALGKLLEKALVARLEAHFRVHNSLSDRQFGFRPGLGTDDAIHTVKSLTDSLPGKYTVGVLLDISGAFDHAWWPAIIDSLKNRGVPGDLIKIIRSYFNHRHVVIDAGDVLVWRSLQRGCPQGSVLGPLLWNVMFDDVLKLPLPDHCELVAYADDLLLLVNADSRTSIELKADIALNSITNWGAENKLSFAPDKTIGILLRGSLDERHPPTLKMNGQKVKFKLQARYLGFILSKNMNPCVHLRQAGIKAREAMCKLARLEGHHWGLKFRARLIMYKAIYTSIVTYAASAWAERSCRGLAQSVLLRTQTTPLKSLTKSYNTASTLSLQVIAGVHPIDLEAQRRSAVFHLRKGRPATVAGKRIFPPVGEPKPSLTEKKIQIQTRAAALEGWQSRWSSADVGRLTYFFLPQVAARLKMTWLRGDHEVTQFLTGHGAFRSYLFRFGFSSDSKCPCGDEDQSSEHILWHCPKLREEREELHSSLELRGNGPLTHQDLVASGRNFRAFERFCTAYIARIDVRPT